MNMNSLKCFDMSTYFLTIYTYAHAYMLNPVLQLKQNLLM